jgi:DNA-directed RNA polymerase subunit RPC12/RpoP
MTPADYPQENAPVSSGASLICPACGAPLKFDPATQQFHCEFCLSKFSKKEIERPTPADVDTIDEALNEYNCPSCGATIVADLNTTADFCAFCGNPVILKGRVSGEIKPNLIIPFSVTKVQAQNILRDFLKKKKFVPASFFSQANLDKVTGVYHPFWELDADTDSSVNVTATTSSHWRSGNKEYTKTNYFNVFRSGEIHMEDISVHALKDADKQLLEGVLPYPIQSHQPFSMEYLSGFYAKKYDLSRKDVEGEARAKMYNYAGKILTDTITGYDSVHIDRQSVVVTHASWDYTLLPIWVLAYRYGGKVYNFAVNGVTGKVFGEIPLSKPKLWLTAGGIAAAVATVVGLIGGLLI